MQRSFQLRRQQVQQIVLGPFFSRADAIADLRRLQAMGGYKDASVIDGTRSPPRSNRPELEPRPDRVIPEQRVEWRVS